MNKKLKKNIERKSKCPVCNRASFDHYKPFCSRRCSYIDLANWFGGKYCVETEKLKVNQE